MTSNKRHITSKKKAKPRRAPRKPKPRSAILARAEEAYRLLYKLYQDIASPTRRSKIQDAHAAEKNHPHQSELADKLVIPFRVDGDAPGFAREFVDLLEACRGDEGKSASFRAGRVYCYHCDSPLCSHAAPPNHLSVFQGYTPTGFPIWEEFFTVLLESYTSRIDDLMDDVPDIVTLCQKKETLIAEQLKIFGKESHLYDIKAQVVAGYLPLPRTAPQARTAVTVQAVRYLDGPRMRIGLNIVGRTPEGKDLVDFLKDAPEPELDGYLRSARKKLEGLRFYGRSGNRSGDISQAAERSLFSTIRHLGNGIERMGRRRHRRTRHAALRSAQRPAVGLALKDLEKAQADRLLYDELHHTYIVVGSKWRIHVYSLNGKHVTSMMLNKEGFQKRLDIKRWRYTTPAEREALRKSVKKKTR